MKYILIKGDNGKKTVATMMIEILKMAGYNVGFLGDDSLDIAITFDDAKDSENICAFCITQICSDDKENLQSNTLEICKNIRENYATISYTMQDEKIKNIIEQSVIANGSKLIIPDLADFSPVDCSIWDNNINYGGYEIKVPLLGVHQSLNAAMAIETSLALCETGLFNIEDDHIIEGIERVVLPARLEVAKGSPIVLLDNASNVDGIKSVISFLKTAKLENLVIIMSANKDANAREMAHLLSPFAESLYALDTENSMPREELVEIASEFISDSVDYDDLNWAIEDALASCEGGVLVCGDEEISLMARKILLFD